MIPPSFRRRTRGVRGVDILEEARHYFISVELFEGYVGHDILSDGEDIVLQFHDLARGAVVSVRFPNPVLPQEGLAYRGVALRNPRDWILDLRVVLGEEIATGALFRSTPIERQGWKEFVVDPERWEGDPERKIGEWADP